ncbi:MAG: hypothetical protein ACP6IY_19040 [Promethearchaeia archaeon]
MNLELMIHFLEYRLRGPDYIDYHKALARKRLTFLLSHPEEQDIFDGFEVYGPEFLDFIRYVIDKEDYAIFDARKASEGYKRNILHWIFRKGERRESN